MGQNVRRLPEKARGGGVLTAIRWFWLAAVLTLAVDLSSKAFVFEMLGGLTPLDSGFGEENVLWLLPGAFKLVCHYNMGGAFGVASGKLFLFLAATAVLVPVLVLVAYHTREPDAPLWSLGLIVGGALGNLWDRLLHKGVRDFLEIVNPETGRNLWPVFNIADVAIVLGVIVYVIWSILDGMRKKRVPPGDDSEATFAGFDGDDGRNDPHYGGLHRY